MPSRTLDFQVFDADNHLYETRDALTKFLPPARAGLIDYVERRRPHEDRRPGPHQRLHPQPDVRAGGRARAPRRSTSRSGNPEGKSRPRDLGQGIDALPAFREPGPRLELMDELGIDRALMLPTLASLVEERLRDDPDAIHAVVHALNEWMHEHWTFNYEGRIFPTPVITLPIVDAGHRGARVGARARRQDHPHPPGAGPGLPGPRSFALPEFDPFWELVAGGRRRGRHARLRQRLPALHQRVGGRPRRRVHAVPGPVGVRGDHRRAAP